MKIPPPNPDHLLFLTAYDPRITELVLATRALVWEEAPEAVELIYDAYSAVSAGYSFTGKPSDTFVYVAAYEKRVNLGFYFGAMLSDPERLLQGTGKLGRHIPIEDVSDVRKPHVRSFVKQAVKLAERPEPGDNVTPGVSVVRAIYTAEAAAGKVGPRSYTRLALQIPQMGACRLTLANHRS